MNASAFTFGTDPVFVRHDLMIELDQLELALEQMRANAANDDQNTRVKILESKRSRIEQLLSRLAV